MLEVISSFVTLVVGLFSSLFSVLVLVAVQVSEMLYHFHMSMPRLEGLVVGVLLTWLLLRREKHPVLRVLSSPLKLVLDILDLAWDQVVEVAADVKQAVVGVASTLKNKTLDVLWGGYDKVMDVLEAAKRKLTSKKD